MGLFSFLFGSDEKETAAGREATPRVGISYDPMLIGKLKEDHQDLVKIFTSIKKAAAEGKFAEIPNILSEFKLALQTHLAVENVRFYVYVQQLYANDLDTSDFITGLRSEMNGIARVVMKFTEKYSAVQLTHSTATSFSSELDEIGAVLTKRVNLEESRLYSLYRSE
ncbi:MAG: hemerythrin domain-containing protein [Gammaproteobacteria bacterium]|nr:hemerythrin domain-containing protein [Gammaproteobacteria bacterium]MBU1482505.1 hemerythrin domain-containing protein [Gammaproteobacteria bacterium]